MKDSRFEPALKWALRDARRKSFQFSFIVAFVVLAAALIMASIERELSDQRAQTWASSRGPAASDFEPAKDPLKRLHNQRSPNGQCASSVSDPKKLLITPDEVPPDNSGTKGDRSIAVWYDRGITPVRKKCETFDNDPFVRRMVAAVTSDPLATSSPERGETRNADRSNYISREQYSDRIFAEFNLQSLKDRFPEL